MTNSAPGSFLLSVCFALASSASLPAQEWAPLWLDAAEIETFLKKAKVTEKKTIGTGVTKPEKVRLELDGEVRFAAFKRVERPGDSWRSEIAAYELDKLLGLGMVPPTVQRRIGLRTGCLQLWVEGVAMMEIEGEPVDPAFWRQQVSVMWLFDDLIANVDRHLNNALVTAEGRLVLIDNSKAFNTIRRLWNDLHGPGTGTHARYWRVVYDAARESYPVSYPSFLLERLELLSEKQVTDAIKRYVSRTQRNRVVDRHRTILERLAAMEGSPQLETASSRSPH